MNKKLDDVARLDLSPGGRALTIALLDVAAEVFMPPTPEERAAAENAAKRQMEDNNKDPAA